MNSMKDEKGITLVALVVTIVVLIILAGVTINILIGDDGIITRAKTGVDVYGKASANEIAAVSEIYNEVNDITKNNTLAKVAKQGDYVEYNSGNGYNGKWRVLYNDNSNKLQIVSTTIVESLTLGGETIEDVKASYNNGIDILNNACQKYINSSYAKSARSIGSNPIEPEDKTIQTCKLSFLWNDSYDTGIKVADLNRESDITAINTYMPDVVSLEDPYWIASRNIELNEDDNGNASVDFYIVINGIPGGAWSNCIFILHHEGGNNQTWQYTRTAGIRPVITLKDDIEISDGNGSETEPYRLIAK